MMTLKNMVPCLLSHPKFTKKNHFLSLNKSVFTPLSFTKSKSLAEQAYKPKIPRYTPVSNLLELIHKHIRY